MAQKIQFKPIPPKNADFFADAEKAVTSELAAAMLGPVARVLVKAEENYIKNWEHKPKIVSEFRHMKTRLKLWVRPKGKNLRYWVFVSQGTKPRIITSDKVMPVRSYAPKTTPAGIYGGSGAYTGGTTFTKSVGHVKRHEIKAREFEKYIVDKYDDTIIQLLGVAIEKALGRI